jgi:hypothetical protein
MKKNIVRGMSERGRRTSNTPPKPRASKHPNDGGGDPHVKGTMREPAQTPDGERGPLDEVREALEDLEKEKGDWSKGG